MSEARYQQLARDFAEVYHNHGETQALAWAFLNIKEDESIDILWSYIEPELRSLGYTFEGEE